MKGTTLLDCEIRNRKLKGLFYLDREVVGLYQNRDLFVVTEDEIVVKLDNQLNRRSGIAHLSKCTLPRHAYPVEIEHSLRTVTSVCTGYGGGHFGFRLDNACVLINEYSEWTHLFHLASKEEASEFSDVELPAAELTSEDWRSLNDVFSELKNGHILVGTHSFEEMSRVELIEEGWEMQAGAITLVIPDTSYSLLILNGVIQPLLVNNTRGRAWELRGIESNPAGIDFARIDDVDLESQVAVLRVK